MTGGGTVVVGTANVYNVEMSGTGNILLIGDILGVIDGRNRIAAIIPLRAELPYIDGPHCLVLLRINIFCLYADAFLNGREHLMTRNQNIDVTKALKKELTVTELLEKVDNYSKVFEREYAIRFVQAIVKDCVVDIIPPKYITGDMGNSHSVPSFHRYARVAKVMRMREPLMDLMTRIALKSYDRDGISNHL